MTTQPRMSSPIGRLRIKTAEGGRRPGSGVGRWRPAESPAEGEMQEPEAGAAKSGHPSFYPFPLRAADQDER